MDNSAKMIDVDGIDVEYEGGEPQEGELEAYVQRGKEKYGDKLQGLHLVFDGEEVEIYYTLYQPSFQRIRRITGYLVGTMDKWNNAKRAEEHDRVKHQAD